MSKEFYKIVGQNIRALRKNKKLTLQDIGDYLGHRNNVIGAYERGERAINLEYIVKLCKFYEVTVNDILPLEDRAPVGEEITQEMKFLETIKSKHFTATEQKLILDFAELLISARSVNIGESYDQRQE